MNANPVFSFSSVWMMITRLPLPAFMLPPTASLPDADDMAAMPVAGGVFALVASLPAWALSFVIPPLPCAVFACAIYVALGWSFHLDGWGDLWDGFGSGRRGDAMRAVMKDSHVGAFGAAGIALALMMRASLLSEVDTDEWLAVCVLAGGVGRLASNAAAYAGTYPWPGGIAGGIVSGSGAKQLAYSVLVSCLLIPFGPVLWLLGVVASLAVGCALSKFSERAMGGTNGDVLGAAAVAGELSVLALACCL